MLKSCLLLVGVPLLVVLGLLFFVGNNQTGESIPYPQSIPPQPFEPSPYVLPTDAPFTPTLMWQQITATAIIREATERSQTLTGMPTLTPTVGSPTAVPYFGPTSTPFPNPT
ncbi:MAG: hypothetical protein HY862_16410 [Chloroflexi bacterium]|nr:hypothetical protein [Chloroflexota bacterium]